MDLYFAYGSNLDRAGMRRRCPGARELGIAVLPEWEVFIATAGYASIRRKIGGRTEGGLWAIGPRDRAALDRYEDVPGRLYTPRAVRVLFGDRMHEALVYEAVRPGVGHPRPGYMEAVVAAARTWPFSAAHQTHLEQLLPRPAESQAENAEDQA